MTYVGKYDQENLGEIVPLLRILIAEVRSLHATVQTDMDRRKHTERERQLDELSAAIKEVSPAEAMRPLSIWGRLRYTLGLS